MPVHSSDEKKKPPNQTLPTHDAPAKNDTHAAAGSLAADKVMAERVPLAVNGTAMLKTDLAPPNVFDPPQARAGDIVLVQAINGDTARAKIAKSVDTVVTIPTAQLTAEPTLPTRTAQSFNDVRFAPMSGALWNGQPVLDDVDQGHLGDCYFAAACGAVVQSDPRAIMKLFDPQTPGLSEYTVTLFVQDPGKRTYHEVKKIVDTNLPVSNYDTKADPLPNMKYRPNPFTDPAWTIDPNDNVDPRQIYMGDMHGQKHQKSLWPALLEKAYAQLLGGSYARVEEGDGLSWQAMDALTGKRTDFQSYEDFRTLSDAALVSKFAGYQSDKKPVTCSTLPDKTDASGTVQSQNVGPLGLLGDHFYVFERLEGDKLVFHNPWGYSHPQPITAAQFKKYFTDINVGG